MRISTMLYALFCMAVVFAYATASWTSSSPFADGGRSAFFYSRGASGPHHK